MIQKLFILALLAALSCPLGSLNAAAADDAAKKDAKAPAESDPEFSITPVVSFADVSGNKSKFREDTWTRDGWTGGIGEFDWHRPISKDTEFSLSGRGVIDQRDYDLHLDVTKRDFGFVRMGFTQYPKYYDSAGGYYPRFSTPSFNLANDPEMDIGHMTFDAGLTLPDLPKITFGYEHQYKDGNKSMLEWGSVTQTLPAGSVYPTGAVTKKIYPGFKAIDENVDIFKLNVDHSFGSLNLGDNFFYEKYDNATSLMDASAVNLPANTASFRQTNEQFKHDLFSNTYHMDQHLNDKVYWSAGYLFTTMNGGGNYNVNNIYYGVAPGGTDTKYNIPVINMNEHCNMGNVNLMFGPFKDLTGYVGMQGEKTHSENFLLGNFATVATATDNRVAYAVLDKKSTEETVGVRYTRIPYTTLYAEARFTQDNYGQDQNQTDLSGNAGNTYGAGIGTDTFKQQYKAGFSTSPWARVNWTTQYMHRREEDNYGINYLTGGDAIPANPYTGAWGAGYIRNLTFDTDDVSTKLALRPCSRVNVTLKYQMLSTDIKSQSINGTIPACQYYQNIYSMSATWTPINRLYVMGMVSYQDTLTSSYDNGSNTMIPYRGNVYSVIGSIGYALDMKSDLDLQVNYSHSDNYVNNGYGPANLGTSQYGMPYLVSYDLTNASIGWKRRLNDHSNVGVRFGFVNNSDPSSGGINDYSAYIATVSYTFRF